MRRSRTLVSGASLEGVFEAVLGCAPEGTDAAC